MQKGNTGNNLAISPNPSENKTIIRWNITQDFKDARLILYDNNGAKINSYKIEHKGTGELQIINSRLSPGIYTYSLIVNGKFADSKKMIKAK